MSKIKLLDDNQIKELIDRFFVEECDSEPKYITFPKVAEYLSKATGKEITPHYIRVHPIARPYIDEIKAQGMSKQYRTVAVYETLDINTFFKRNNTEEKLRRAIIERDKYYQDVALSSMEIFDEFEKANSNLKRLKKSRNEELEQLKIENKKIKKRISAEKELRMSYEAGYKELKKIVEKYVYDDMAKQLLAKRGSLIIAAESNIKGDAFSADIITPDTEIPAKFSHTTTKDEDVENSVVSNEKAEINSLFHDFAEDDYE